MKPDKRGIITSIILLILFMLCAACSNTAEQGPGPGETGELDIKWVDPGIEHESLTFEAANEGLYLLKAALAGGGFKFGFMDEAGTVVIPLIYDYATVFSEGLAYAEMDGRKFFIGPDGNEALDVSEYFSGSPFEFGYAMVTRLHTEEIENGVRQEFLRGLIDKSGNEVLPADYSEAAAFENGVLMAAQEWKYAIFDGAGNRLTRHEFDSVGYAGEGLLIVQKDGLFGYIDSSGKEITPIEFIMAREFNDGRAFVANEEWLAGYINAKGEKIIPMKFEQAADFSEERAAVMIDGLFGYIDIHGEVVIPCEYDAAWSFDGGVAVVIQNFGRNIVRAIPIDKNGETAIVPKEMGYFRWQDKNIAYYDPELGAAVFDLNYLALLDDDGNRLTEFYYTDISGFKHGVAVVEEYYNYGLFYGLINQKGAEIIPVMYERVEIVDNNTVILQFFESATGSSRVGIAALPEDTASREPEPLMIQEQAAGR